MKRATAAGVMALMLAGCAARPERIPAAAVPHQAYMASDCVQLAASMGKARGALERVWSQQAAKADLDTTSVLIAFVPASAFTGDHAADVARYKGEVVAIGTALASKGCAAAKAA